MAVRVLPVVAWYNKSPNELMFSFPLGAEPSTQPKIELAQARLITILVECPGREYRDSIKLSGPILTISHQLEPAKSPGEKPRVSVVLKKPSSMKKRWDALSADEKPNIKRDWETEDQIWPLGEEEELDIDQNCQVLEDSKDSIFYMRKIDAKEMENLGMLINKPQKKIAITPPDGNLKNPEYIQKLSELDIDDHLLDDHIPKKSKNPRMTDEDDSSESDEFMAVKGGDFVSEVTGLKAKLPEDCEDMPPLEPKCSDKPGLPTEVKFKPSDLIPNNSAPKASTSSYE